MTALSRLFALVAALVTVAACAGTVQPEPNPARDASPAWGACPPTATKTMHARQECATIQVPVDYGQPAGQRISLAISRIRSERPELRRGVLLLIPGGPGSPGLARPSTYLSRLPAEVRDRYDLVGFDPRGLGASTPVSCQLNGDDMVPAVMKPWPAPNGDISANVARARRLAEGCARNGGPVLPHISTRTNARDIEQIRRALGEQKISYWGVSYGTYAGAAYATMFPEHTDRVVLDSNDDPNPLLVAQGWLANYAVSVEDRFPDFAAWTAARHGEYGLGADPQAVRATFLRLTTQLDQRPMPWPGARPAELSGNILRDIMLNALYSDAGFPRLAALMQAASNAGPLPPSDPLPPESALQNSAAVVMATVCNDVKWPSSISHYPAEVARNRAAFPLTAGMPANLFPCSFWPASSAEPAIQITPRGPSNVLLIQNLRDPSTPHTGALQMRRALGDRARMVTVDSGGHGAYLANGNSCGDRTVTTFLSDGTRPDQDIVCPTEKPG
jgi:pimeloyl-ACP methyl ester carboxylesterase